MTWTGAACSRTTGINLLRSRERRHEDPLDVHIPEPIVSHESGVDPEYEAVLADSVGLALMVGCETLSPAERLAFVLHDLFAVAFEEIATLLDRSPAAVRQLASRARRRVGEQAPPPDPDVRRQREVVDAFFAASRKGDLDGLVAVLDPGVILRSDGGPDRPRLTLVLRGPREVSRQAFAASGLSPYVRPVLINGAAGVLVATEDRPLFLMAFTVADGRVVAIDVLADRERLQRLDLPGPSRHQGRHTTLTI